LVNFGSILNTGFFVLLGALVQRVVRAVMSDGRQLGGRRVVVREVGLGTRRGGFCAVLCSRD
jgi:hypothetical protein